MNPNETYYRATITVLVSRPADLSKHTKADVSNRIGKTFNSDFNVIEWNYVDEPELVWCEGSDTDDNYWNERADAGDQIHDLPKVTDYDRWLTLVATGQTMLGFFEWEKSA